MKFSGRKELVKYFHHYGPPDVSNTNCGNELSSNTDNYCPFLAVATTPATHSYTGWSMQMPVLVNDWFLILQKMNLEKSTSQFKYVCVLYIEIVQNCIRTDQISAKLIILYQNGLNLKNLSEWIRSYLNVLYCISFEQIVSEWILSYQNWCHHQNGSACIRMEHMEQIWS